MSNEPKSNNSEWQMPDPVFQTSEGRTPRSAKNYVDPDDVDTAAPEFAEADTDEFDTEPDTLSQDEIDTETPEADSDEAPVSENQPPPQEPVRAAAAQKQAGGCAKTFGLISAVIAFSVIAVIAVIIYFLVFYEPADTAF